MKRCLSLLIGILFLVSLSRPAYSELSMMRGEILRFYETRVDDWSSYILIKDSFNHELQFHVHPKITVIRRGSQIEDVGQLTGGMKVTILYRASKDGTLEASVIQIGGGTHV